ncbi:hypothetical protein OH768_31015 [Streptomyces sp. NBC_01622]|uniref:hypothetical protein n=1 Tax=Streptomyces sp. NBC_01622 TaxID=2975903 RepID=UPI0038647913|nr:hypothetical protein OH768_31015 [Streptomyces sp. NBC_01622]
MPTFRQPEWQQPADRHTEIVDPVLTVRQLSRFEFNLKSYVRIDHALVFATGKGGYVAYLPPQRPTRGDIAANRYTAVYEVDMGVHPHTCDLTLPSDNDAFEFTAAVDLSWQVLDPVRFVASGHRNVPGLLLGELQQAARPVTRRFAIADSASAEVELLERMNLLGPLGAPAGLQVTWTLRLKRDEANIEHELRKQAIEHSADEQIRAAQRGMDIDVEVDRRYRQSDSLQLDRAMQYGTHQQELLLQQQRWQHAQALLAGQQQLELQRLEEEKINFYQFHLQQGGVHQWALHLAQHPEDSHMVMNSMREDQLRMIQAQMELVQQLLNGDTAENWELEGPKQLALRTVNDILTQRLPGVPQNPPPPPLPPGAGPEYPGEPIAGSPPGMGPGPGMATPSAPAPGSHPADEQGLGGQPTAMGPYVPGQGGVPRGYAAGQGAAPGAYAGGPGTAPGAYASGPGAYAAGQSSAPGAYAGGQGAVPGAYAGGQPLAPGAYVPGQAPTAGAYAPGQAAETGPYGPGQASAPGAHAPGQTPAPGPYGPGQSPATSPYGPGQGAASGAFPSGSNPSGPYPSGPYPGAPTAVPGTAGPFPGAPGHAASGQSPAQAGPTGPAGPTAPSGPAGPVGSAGVAPYPQGPVAGMPASTPYGSPPAGHAPQGSYPDAPAQPPASSPAALPQPSGQHSGSAPAALSKAPADQSPASAAPEASTPQPPTPAATPEGSAWQPPPGYGRTPTLPEVAAGAEEEDVEEADGPEGGV